MKSRNVMGGRFLWITLVFALGQLVIGARPLAAQGGCQLVLDAMSKVFDTPSHSYVTTNMGGTTQTGEMIFAAGTSYTKYGGKWSVSLMSLQDSKELDQKNRQKNKMTCQYLRDELVSGEMAAIYSVHEETPKQGKTDSQVWVSKSKGLLLRSEIDLGEKMHISTRVEYGNVRPPM